MSEKADQPDSAVLVSHLKDQGGTEDWEKTLRRIIKSEIRRALPRAIEEVNRESGRDETIAGLIHLLAARSNDAKDEVVRKALTLYGLALDAREKGNKVVIVNAEDYIIHEVIGFESMVEALGSHKN